MLTTLLTGVGGTAISVALARWGRRVEAADRVRSLRGRVRRLPPVARVRLAAALDDAALEVTPEAAVQVWVLGAACAAILAGAVVPVFVVPVVAGALAAGPVGLRLARQRRARLAAAAVPPALEAIAAELRSGATVLSAVLGGTGAEGPLAADFAAIRARVELGASLTEALAAWASERDVSGVRAAAGALAVAGLAGGRAAEALDGLAASLRGRLGVVAEARALSSQARLSAVVVGGAPLAYLCLSAAVDRSSVELLVTTPVGLTCLGVGLLLEVLAALWMRRITSEEH